MRDNSSALLGWVMTSKRKHVFSKGWTKTPLHLSIYETCLKRICNIQRKCDWDFLSHHVCSFTITLKLQSLCHLLFSSIFRNYHSHNNVYFSDEIYMLEKNNFFSFSYIYLLINTSYRIQNLLYVVETVRILSMGQIDLSKNYLYSMVPSSKKTSYETTTQKCYYKRTMNTIP